jgi:hypothetical protein
MKTILTVLGVLIGPILGYFTAYCLFFVVERGSCMDKFVANAAGWVFGVPIGAVTFGIIGFWLGSRLDKKAKQLQLDDGGNSELEA